MPIPRLVLPQRFRVVALPAEAGAQIADQQSYRQGREPQDDRAIDQVTPRCIRAERSDENAVQFGPNHARDAQYREDRRADKSALSQQQTSGQQGGWIHHDGHVVNPLVGGAQQNGRGHQQRKYEQVRRPLRRPKPVYPPTGQKTNALANQHGDRLAVAHHGIMRDGQKHAEGQPEAKDVDNPTDARGLRLREYRRSQQGANGFEHGGKCGDGACEFATLDLRYRRIYIGQLTRPLSGNTYPRKAWSIA